jgi:hypothetical protein
VQYTVLAEIPATSPADEHSIKKCGLHQPWPSPYSPTSVTSGSTPATTPRPPADPAGSIFDERPVHDQVSVFGSDGFCGFYGECESGCSSATGRAGGGVPPLLPAGAVH